MSRWLTKDVSRNLWLRVPLVSYVISVALYLLMETNLWFRVVA